MAKSAKKKTKKTKKKLVKGKKRATTRLRQRTSARQGSKKGKKTKKGGKKKKVTKARASKATRGTKATTSKKTAARTKAIQAASTKAKEKLLGKVVHYYDRIGVAIVDLESPLKVGDTVLMKHGETETTQRVASMQIEHASIAAAKKGDIVGLKVDQEVKEGSKVLPA